MTGLKIEEVNVHIQGVNTEVNKNEENKDFKIIAISGTDNPQIVQEAYKLEIDESKTEKKEKQEGIFKTLLTNKNYVFILLVIMMTQIVVDSAGAYAGNHLGTRCKQR